jgi:hypothetical protein
MRHRILQPATDLRCAMWITRVTSRLGRDELNRLRYVTEQQLMTGTERKSACTVRITVKLRPDEYDELFRPCVRDWLDDERFFPRERGKGDEGETSRHGAQPHAAKMRGLSNQWRSFPM